jgi:vitamin B12 transporter
MRSISLNTALLMMFVTPPLFSQDTTRTYLLEEVVVTATRLEKNPADVGRSITVLTGEQLRDNMYMNVGEALTQQGGTYVVGAGQNPGMPHSIFMRGAASNQTIVLVDDIPVVDPSSPNRTLEASELSFAGLDRIEIVRGSHSTLYGSSAIGGVVNFITQKNRQPGYHANAGLGAGTFGKGTFHNVQDLAVQYSSSIGFYMSTHFERTAVKGLDATIDTVTDPTVFKNRDRDNFNKRDILGKIGFKNKQVDFFVSLKNTQQKAAFDKRAYIDDDNSVLDFTRNLMTYGGSYRFSDRFAMKLVGGFSGMKRTAVDDSSVVDVFGNTDQTYFESRWKGTTLTNELQANITLPDIEGVVGIGAHRETMGFQSYFYSGAFGPYESRTNLDTLDPHSATTSMFSHFGVRGSLLNSTFERFSLGLGLRYNQHSIYGRNATYAINPSYRVGDFALLYVSYTTGFNAPSLYQLYTPEKNFVSGITRGNKNLKPEISSSFEVGINQVVNNRLSFGVSYFHTIVENVIEYVYLWDKNIGIDTLGFNDYRGDTYVNLGTQTNRGIEFSLHSKISDQLEFSGNFSLVSGKLRYKPSDVDVSHTQGNHVQIFNNGAFINKEVESLGLVRRPNTANVSLTYKPIERLALRIDARHVGARSDIFYSSVLGPFGALGTVPVADYTLVDFSQRFILDEHVSISTKIANVLNTKYAEINGFTTRGRGVYLRVRYSL